MRKNYFLWLLALFPALTWAQEYQLVWEDNFDGTALNADVWNVETQVGIWNTGSNRELQHYRAGNVSVGPDGFGNNALIITAKREVYNGYQFTSGRINTRHKVAARYGKIEARIKLPVLANGLWPAFWTLGTQNGWPACGEIDILEAGHQQGITNNQQERTLNGALHWLHQGGYAGYGPQALAPVGTSLYNYNKFTLIWTPNRIEMFLNDGTTPYFAMDITGADAEEFRNWPHYFIFNLAVGGSFPGITNPANITAPLPANMYVDYIRVYQKQGEGELVVTPPVAPPSDDYYGIFTERASITKKFNIDNVTGHLYLWNNLVASTGQAPYEGSELLAFQSPGAGWSGFGIFSGVPLDLSYYATGYLNFAIKIPSGSTQTFTVLMEGKENTKGEIVFTPGADPYGVKRDGSWYFVSFPMGQLTGQGLNLSACGNIFAVASGAQTPGYFFDDVYLSVSKPTYINKPSVETGDMKLYPNPASETFNVYSENGIKTIIVNDISGKTIFHQLISSPVYTNPVNSSGWNKGLYLVEVVDQLGYKNISKIRIK